MRRGLLVAIVACATCAAGCASPDAAAGPGVGGPDAGAPDAVAGVAACDEQETGAVTIEPPGGLPLPEGARVTSASTDGPVTTVTAYAEGTPVRLRQELEALPSVEVLSAEDEGFEAELLLDVDDARVYVRVSAICASGSDVLLVRAPASSAALPTLPGG